MFLLGNDNLPNLSKVRMLFFFLFFFVRFTRQVLSNNLPIFSIDASVPSCNTNGFRRSDRRLWDNTILVILIRSARTCVRSKDDLSQNFYSDSGFTSKMAKDGRTDMKKKSFHLKYEKETCFTLALKYEITFHSAQQNVRNIKTSEIVKKKKKNINL